MTFTTESLQEFKSYVKNELAGGIIKDTVIEHECLTFIVEPKNILKILRFLRDDARCHFKQLVDIFGVDYLEREKRFEVIYNLLSLKYNLRVRIKLYLAENSDVPSAVGLFSCADWLEREVWDMYGIFFASHPDLRRILSDYGFEGHPQRKDFPLSGYVELRYDNIQAKVVYEPVKLSQEYRNFDFLSPWEGTIYHIPEDNK